MPAPQSDLAQQIVKDPYTFEFLSLSADMQERDLERGLLEHLRLFILELERASLSLAANTISKLVARTTISIYFSTICACAASWSLN